MNLTRRSAVSAALALVAGQTLPHDDASTPPPIDPTPPVEPTPARDRVSIPYFDGGSLRRLVYTETPSDGTGDYWRMPEESGPGEFHFRQVAAETIPLPPEPGADHPRPVRVTCCEDKTVLNRDWRTEDVPKCKLCTTKCNALEYSPVDKPGQSFCWVCLAPDFQFVKVEEAALYTARWPWEHLD